jgi:hypothetical protein
MGAKDRARFQRLGGLLMGRDGMPLRAVTLPCYIALSHRRQIG